MYRVGTFVRLFAEFMLVLTCLGASSIVLGQTEASELRIRVLIKEKQEKVVVQALDLSVENLAVSQVLVQSTNSPMKIQQEKGQLSLNGKPTGSDRLWLSSPMVYLTLDGKEYRGPLELRLELSGIFAVLHLTLESYLLGTLPGEMPGDWPLEALKAQAVVARTYAWMQVERHRQDPWDIRSDVRDQVYVGERGEQIRVAQAVRTTESIVLRQNEALVEAFYHSTCGGQTEVPGLVWKHATQEQTGVKCAFCSESPGSTWKLRLQADELAQLLKEEGFSSPTVTRLEIEQRSVSGRALQLRVEGERGSILLDGNTLRKRVGFSRLKSTRFDIERKGKELLFTGQGFGHGAGMCQWGARGQALAGYRAEDILQHYYPGSRRIKLAPANQAGEGEQKVP